MEDSSSDSDDSFTTSAGTVDSSDEDSSTVIVISSDSNQSTDYFSTGTDSSSDSSDSSMGSHTDGFATDTGSFSGAEGGEVEEVAMEIESSASNSPEPVLQRLPAPRFEVADPPAELPEVPVAPAPVGDAIVPEDPQPGPSATVKPADKEEVSKNTLKRSASALVEDNSDDENDQRCPICLDVWTGTGEHRLVSLACGHLFGKSCIERWMKKGGSGKRCPQCNNPCKTRDIRPLFASAVKVKEVAEEERLTQQLQQALKEKRELELRLMKTELKVAQLEKKEEQPARASVITPHIPAPGKYVFRLAKEVTIGEKGGGRVMSYCPWATQLSVSQASKLCGYGLMRISCERDFSVQTLESLHGKMIRDIAYYPGQQNSLLLTASLDRSAKLVDYRCNLAVQTYKVQAPLWSCCWDLTGCATDCHLVTLGLTTGVVARFDIRKVTLDPVALLGKREGVQAVGGSTPVSSLVSLPPGHCPALPRGGLIASQLTTCRLYVGDQDMDGVVLPFLSPILCLRSEPVSGHLLVSSRATSTRPTTHTVFKVSRERNVAPAEMFENVLSIQGANRQSMLTRPCITTFSDREMIVASNHEETRTVPIWSVGTGQQINSLPTAEDVLDICNMSVNNTNYVGLLTDKKLAIYQFK